MESKGSKSEPEQEMKLMHSSLRLTQSYECLLRVKVFQDCFELLHMPSDIKVCVNNKWLTLYKTVEAFLTGTHVLHSREGR